MKKTIGTSLIPLLACLLILTSINQKSICAEPTKEDAQKFFWHCERNNYGFNKEETERLGALINEQQKPNHNYEHLGFENYYGPTRRAALNLFKELTKDKKNTPKLSKYKNDKHYEKVKLALKNLSPHTIASLHFIAVRNKKSWAPNFIKKNFPCLVQTTFFKGHSYRTRTEAVKYGLEKNGYVTQATQDYLLAKYGEEFLFVCCHTEEGEDKLLEAVKKVKKEIDDLHKPVNN